jgi:hypothetical protein
MPEVFSYALTGSTSVYLGTTGMPVTTVTELLAEEIPRNIETRFEIG